MTQMLSAAEVASATGLSRTTIWRQMRRQAFPEPVQLSPGRVAWRSDDIARHLGVSEIQPQLLPAPTNKGGRPPKGPIRGKSAVFQTRITPEMRRAIEVEADRTGMSLSQVAERWLEDGRLYAAMKKRILEEASVGR